MPLVQIALRTGRSETYKSALFEGIYAALRATFAVPEDDRFMTITEHGADDLSISPTYAGMDRSKDCVIIRITVSNTRGVAQKQALYQAIVDQLARDPGVRPDDVFINLVEVKPENWSFGRGIAQYVSAPPTSTSAEA
jgi:phenylpyruvate tautomerase PptA (4-oxalocrotonate tautomerase family)